jgi:hypothetical protein
MQRQTAQTARSRTDSTIHHVGARAISVANSLTHTGPEGARYKKNSWSSWDGGVGVGRASSWTSKQASKPIMASHSHRSRSPTAPCPSWGHAHAPRCRRRLVRALLLVAALALAAAGGGGRGSAAAAAAATQQRIPAIFMFGDSIVDPGNNNNRLTEAKANFPPYGQDFPGGVATGRFSNGLVPGDLLGTYVELFRLIS